MNHNTRKDTDDEMKMIVEVLEVHTDIININRTLIMKLFDNVQTLQKVVLYLLDKRSQLRFCFFAKITYSFIEKYIFYGGIRYVEN